MTTPWRTDPHLQGKFPPTHPDDVQVLVHDGELRRTQRGPEGCWVHITGVGGVLRSPIAPPNAQPPLTAASVQWLERTIYVGQLLNQPTNLTTVRQGASVRFVHTPGIPQPLMITPQYEAERARWAFTPCDRCGADQALDPMSTMAQTRFPNAPQGAVPMAFSAFCPCGGTMLLNQVEGAPALAPAPNAFGPTGVAAGSFSAPAGLVPPVNNSPSASRVFLIAGVGCLSLVSMCCLSGVGGFFYARGGQETLATDYASRFLALAQARQWNEALAASEYRGGSSLYTVDSFTACFEATPLAEMTSYTCDSASSEWPLDNGAEVICTITTPRGPTEITVHVNSTDTSPYLGYVWFSADSTVGAAWHTEDCARWSGSRYFGETPANRVRP